MADDKWFYEQRNLGGGWSPCTSANQPLTVTVNGFNCLRRVDGTAGPRVRRIYKVDPALAHLTLDELSRVLPMVKSDG